MSAESQQLFIEEMFSLPGLHLGINVIGASGGAEFALESEKWNNGVFTAALIEALRDKKADANGDGRVGVGELRSYLADRVSKLTGGAQKPSVVAFERDQDFDIISARNDKLRTSRGVAKTGVPRDPHSSAGVWLFPDSSQRLLARDELAQLNTDDLWRARNEIFARKGFIFQTAKGKAFAASLESVYTPLSADQDEIRIRMNATERANIKLIQSLEDKK
jgi:hypothetical protein